MTDEEKQAIEYIRNCLDDKYEFKNATRYKDIKYHNIVLNLIDKQQKEIEELNLDLEEMTKSNNHKKEYWVHKSILNSYVSKDKIKEKIKEVENREENYTFDKLTSEDIRRTIITNLEELLGE